MIFGWDISTSIVGLAVLTDEGAFVDASFLDLRKADADLIEKSYAFEDFVNELVPQWPGQAVHYVEDRLSNFAAGKTMLQTLMKLAAFNATCSYIVWRQFHHNHPEGSEIYHLHPSSVKSVMRKQGLVIPKGADKKALTLQWVSEREPDFPVSMNKNGNPQPYCFDMADAYCVAKAGYLQGCGKNEK